MDKVAYMLPCVEWIADEELLYNTGESTKDSAMTWRVRMGEWKQVPEGRDICIISV